MRNARGGNIFWQHQAGKNENQSTLLSAKNNLKKIRITMVLLSLFSNSFEGN
jgi:hypothetical protein